MAKRYITVDDLTGEEAETTEVAVTINGTKKTLDLTAQSLAALQAVWEVPNVEVMGRALRWLNDAGVSNIAVGIAP